jgi:sugar phosphate isomerase/epimerase
MRLGLGSFAYAWSIGVGGRQPADPLTALGLVELAARLGVGLVEMDDNLPLHTLPSDELDALQVQAASLGVGIRVGARGSDPALLRRYLDLATRFGSPIVRTVMDTATHRPSMDELCAAWRPLLPAYEERGVILAVENHDRFRARELIRLMQRLDSAAVGICLDTANSFGALEGPDVALPALAPWTVHLHLKDFTIARANENMGFVVQGCPTGQGLLDVPWVLALLHSHGRDPDAIIELWPAPEPTLEATIAKERRWAEESMAYMRRLLPG